MSFPLYAHTTLLPLPADREGARRAAARFSYRVAHGWSAVRAISVPKLDPVTCGKLAAAARSKKRGIRVVVGRHQRKLITVLDPKLLLQAAAA